MTQRTPKQPTHWKKRSLGAVLPLSYGKALPAAKRSGTGEFPVFGSSGEVGSHDTALTSGPAIVVGRKGNVGATFYSPKPCWAIDTAYFTEGTEETDLRFFAYLLRSLQLAKLDRSTAIPGLSRDDYNAQEAPVPPLDDQRLVVATLDSYFSRLDDVEAGLERVQRNLKRYRASVLQAAVTGRLVPTEAELARAEGREYEPAEQLLESSLSERRNRWKKSKQKTKYKEPAKPDTSDLQELPEGWTWATLEQLTERVTVGHVGPMKSEYRNQGVPFLRGQNVRPGRYSSEGLKYISRQFHAILSKSSLTPGDLLIVRSGAVGTTCVVPDFLSEANCSDLVIAKGPIGIRPQLAAHYLNSLAKGAIRSQQVGVALTHFNTKSAAKLPFPLPPLPEQDRILEASERILSVADEIGKQVEWQLARCRHLRQTTLHAAFQGRLVQTSSDNSPAKSQGRRRAS